MDVYESDLPGVGKKFEVELDGEKRLVIVIHNTGKRELFVRPEPNADAEKLFELTDRQARQVGTIMEGAYFQPIRVGTIDTVIGENTLIDWVKVTKESPAAGRTLGEARLRERTGASVIAIQRDDETITNPGAPTRLEAGDTLVILGSREECTAAEDAVTPTDADRAVDEEGEEPADDEADRT